MIKKQSLLEAIFAILTIFVLLFFSYKPIYENFKRAPQDVYYYGSFDYPLDLTGNLATVREGYLGHWMRVPKITSTIEGKPTFLKIEYILVGQLARFFHTDPVFMYFFSRAILSFVFLVVLYLVIRTVFPTKKQRIVAYIFCLFATGIIIPAQNGGVMHTLPVDALVLQRLVTATHHYLLSDLFCILSLFFLSLAIDGKRKKYIFLASVFGFLATLFHPAVMFLVFLSLPLYILLKLIRGRLVGNAGFMKAELFIVGIYVFISVLPIFYFRYATQFWDFNMLAKTEHIVPFSMTPLTYLQALGLTYVFSLFAYIPIMRTGKTFFLLLIPWVFVHPFSILVVSGFMDINSIRFFLTPYFIVFSILSTVGIFSLGKKTGSIFTSICVICVLAAGYYSYQASTTAQEVCFCMVPSVYDYGYPKMEVMDALFWLSDNTTEQDVVLSGLYAGSLIPAFSGNTVYTSWWHYLMDPPNIDGTIVSVDTFYSSAMRPEDAREFLQKNRIRYVFWGVEEQKKRVDVAGLSYPFLKVVFKRNNTILYAVE